MDGPDADVCSCDPAPPNWTQVPHDDRSRLNHVIAHLAKMMKDSSNGTEESGIYSAELDIVHDGYTWKVYPMPGQQIRLDLYERIEKEPHVTNVQVRMREGGGKSFTRGAICISVSSVAHDIECGSAKCSTSGCASLDGELSTRVVLLDNKSGLAEVAALAAAYDCGGF